MESSLLSKTELIGHTLQGIVKNGMLLLLKFTQVVLSELFLECAGVLMLL